MIFKGAVFLFEFPYVLWSELFRSLDMLLMFTKNRTLHKRCEGCGTRIFYSPVFDSARKGCSFSFLDSLGGGGEQAKCVVADAVDLFARQARVTE